jgi:hypothetical protein
MLLPIEPLESRIAPAALLKPRVLTYTDIDGDEVRVTLSAGAFSSSDFIFDTPFDSTGSQQLLRIDFAGDTDKARASLTFSVTKVVGDGKVNVGFLEATGLDLGTVTIPGDLGRIKAGDANTATPALAALNVGSMGTLGTTTQEAGGSLLSEIRGGLTALKVDGDFQEATLRIEGGLDARIGRIEVAGHVIGGAADESGAIRAQGAIGPVKIGGQVRGGSGLDSGQVFTESRMGVVKVEDAIIGGAGKNSGQVFAAGRMGLATIAGDILGGEGEKSGQLSSFTALAGVTVLGSIVGGGGKESGAIGASGAIGFVKLTGNLSGNDAGTLGDGEQSGTILCQGAIGMIEIGGDISGGKGRQSGLIGSAKTIASVIIGGSVRGGTGEFSGSIGSDGALGRVQVRGDLAGGDGLRTGQIVSAASIARVDVTGSVLGGSGEDSAAIGSPGSIGVVKIGADFTGGTGFRSGWIVSNGRLGFIDIGGNMAADGTFGSVIEGRNLGTINIRGSIGDEFGSRSAGLIYGRNLEALNVTGSIFANGSFDTFIEIRNRIGAVTIGQDLRGAADGGARVHIEAGTAIDSITVGGSVFLTDIFVGVGFDPIERPANPDAQVGRVIVAGNWTASNLVVGCFPGQDGIFGTSDDDIVNGGDPTVFSTIRRVVIGGSAEGGSSVYANMPFRSITAQHVIAVKIAGNPVALQAGPRNDVVNLTPDTGDFFVRERRSRGGSA